MQVADDDASVRGSCSASSRVCAASLWSVTSVANCSWMAWATPWGYWSAATRATDDQRRWPRSRPRPPRDRRASDPVCWGAVRGAPEPAGCGM